MHVQDLHSEACAFMSAAYVSHECETIATREFFTHTFHLHVDHCSMERTSPCYPVASHATKLHVHQLTGSACARIGKLGTYLAPGCCHIEIRSYGPMGQLFVAWKSRSVLQPKPSLFVHYPLGLHPSPPRQTTPSVWIEWLDADTVLAYLLASAGSPATGLPPLAMGRQRALTSALRSCKIPAARGVCCYLLDIFVLRRQLWTLHGQSNRPPQPLDSKMYHASCFGKPTLGLHQKPRVGSS